MNPSYRNLSTWISFLPMSARFVGSRHSVDVGLVRGQPAFCRCRLGSWAARFLSVSAWFVGSRPKVGRWRSGGP
jgi:hypothetical protein